MAESPMIRAFPMQMVTVRFLNLDALRGIAVFAVLITHAPWPNSIRGGVIEKLLNLGAHGVDLFFVLSGFLISNILYAELRSTESISLFRFWMRRGFKIWPSYYAAYLLGSVGFYFANSDHGSSKQLFDPANFVFLQNYWHIENRWFASWSLAVEEHFYFFLPLLMLLLRNRTHLVTLLVACCVVVPFLRYHCTDETRVWIQTHYRMDSLCAGVILNQLYWIRHEKNLSLLRQPLPLFVCSAIVIAILILCPSNHPLYRSIGFSLVTALAFCWVAYAISVPEWQISTNSPVRTFAQILSVIGIYSYTIYLSQYLTLALIALVGRYASVGFIFGRSIVQITCFILGSLIIGFILSHSVERPFLRLRSRMWQQPKPIQ